MVKRDPDEVKLPQIVRPNSNGPEQSPLPPPPTHGPPPSHMEERRHMSYDSGPAPQLYRHPSYPPPQTPLSHPGPPPTPYEQTQMYATPSMGPDGPYPITYTTGGGKRKSQRASQVCTIPPPPKKKEKKIHLVTYTPKGMRELSTAQSQVR